MLRADSSGKLAMIFAICNFFPTIIRPTLDRLSKKMDQYYDRDTQVIRHTIRS